MASLPSTSAGDVWGSQLNTYLLVAHNADGSLKNHFVNVKDPAYGAVGDGTTDDTAAFTAALAALTTGSCLFLPQGIYIISSSLYFPGSCSIIGVGNNSTGSVIRVAANTNLTTPVLASDDWYDNDSYSGAPVHLANFSIDCSQTNATSGTSAHGLVLMNYWSSVHKVSISSPTGHGLYYTAHNRGGTHILNTCVEPKFIEVEVRSAGQYGIYIYDDGTGLNSCTDGFMRDCIVADSGLDDIRCDMSPGWLFDGNHTYGGDHHGMYLDKCYGTRVHGNYIDGFSSSGRTYDNGIYMGMLDGRGSSCVGNHVGFESSAGTYQEGIVLTGRGSNVAMVTCSDNTVNGGSQTGSIGFVYQTTVGQRSYSYYVYHDGTNHAQNVSAELYMDAYVTGGDNKYIGHLSCLSQNRPTGAAGAQAGASAPSPVLSNCTDAAGRVTFGTGTGSSAGEMVVLTLDTAYANNPSVVVTPLNAVTAALNLYVTRTTTAISVCCANAPTDSQANTTYAFCYQVMAL